MPDVFINYRTGDGEKTALLLEKELSAILGGEERIFRATRSIKPGQRFPEELLGNVRRSTVLLAVIGPNWIQSPRLHDEDDWVRRELLEAFALGIPVVPVLEGHRTKRLDRAELPVELAWLADTQSVHVDLEDLQADLTRLVARLADWVPSFRAVNHLRPPAPGSATNSAGDVHGTAIQGRDITTGDVGTVIKGDNGTIHAGKGNIYRDSQHFSGDGAAYVAGDNHGGIGHQFGDSHKNEENGR
ncbi:toll/interleukin-1 receptor domain-containing protein [Streptosporangium amethystogenes]|uniref:toll/interleukin-1 receptor domain-containing protein n=1 Tax=Streptosporangium amethystogenes TaxID=2002 RepID=UPI0004C5FD61|nr:toll/interleukin-1 receptor domain-containing protein [Streptosporangium amethystogenes]